MKSERKSATGAAVAIAVWLLMMPASLISQPSGSPALKPALSSLTFFVGDWECSGKFNSSGKAIEARQHFEPDLDGAWLMFRHDDKPPFNYHALAEWGWDTNRKEFLMAVQDSAGGIRLFRSSGWNSTQLQWDGDAMEASSVPEQRFNFERLDDRHFKVSYFTRRNGDWSPVDTSTCSKQ